MNADHPESTTDADSARRKALVERNYALWSERGNRHLESFILHRSNAHHRHASYELFQAAEAFYGAVVLVFVGEKPWSHDLRMFQRTAVQCDPQFAQIFAEGDREDRRLLTLLNEACMGARYDHDFGVTESDLLVLHEKVKLLADLVERACQLKLSER